MAEHRTVDARVVGSTPIAHPDKNDLLNEGLFVSADARVVPRGYDMGSTPIAHPDKNGLLNEGLFFTWMPRLYPKGVMWV